MADTFDIDPHLLLEFLAESQETLEGLDPLFVQLEKSPDDVSLIDQIFRPVHSIKGNSSFFGLTNVKNFSHEMEDILQAVRGGKLVASKAIIDTLLAGFDLLREMLVRIADGDMSTELLPPEKELLTKLCEVSGSEEAAIADRAANAVTASEQALALAQETPAADAVQAAHTALLALINAALPSTLPTVANAADCAFYLASEEVTEQVKNLTSFLAEVATASTVPERVDEFLSTLETLIEKATAANNPTVVEGVADLQDNFKTIHECGIGFDEMMSELLEEKVAPILAGLEQKAVADANKNAAAEESEKTAESPTEKSSDTPPPPPKPTAEPGGKTLRVAEEKVDHFMSFVGELIIAGEVFSYIQKKLEQYPEIRELTQEFKNANLQFSELSTSLQVSLMEVRRLPIRSLVQKLPRIVRDVSAQLNKKITLHIEGEDVQIDKSLLENLESPLVHMVRNSVDHGVELPEVRVANNKPATGNVWVRASADDEWFRLVIEDDGGGLDLEAIKAKAIQTGLLSEEQAREMSDREAGLLIFGAGVSTAKKVTDVSGRGVGMDVVRSNITNMNGTVDVDTVLGKGTTITISLPASVTLLVVDGLVGRIGTTSYIIPLAEVRESIRPESSQIKTVTGKGEMINVRGTLYPLIRMYNMLDIDTHIIDPAQATVVLAEKNGFSCGLMVDELLGQQSVVLKDLGKEFRKLRIIQGGAILGDGRVGLVLDIGGILESVS